MSTPLRLTLEVQTNAQLLRGRSARRVFDARGGTIGRTDNNDWPLPSAGVSRHHATVHWSDGQFLIEDCSTNGVTLNGEVLPKRAPRPLHDGDRLSIDEFQISVSVAVSAGETSALGELGISAPPPVDLLAADTGEIPLMATSPAPADPLQLLGGPASAPPQPPPVAASWNHTPGISDQFTPPVAASTPAAAGGSVIPEDWDLSRMQAPLRLIPSEAPEPAPAAPQAPPGPLPDSARDLPDPMPEMFLSPAPARGQMVAVVPPPAAAPVATVPTGDRVLAELLAAAGLDPAQVPVEVAQQLGTILHTVVDGMVEALRARAQTKSEFRMDMTRAQSRGNNPLKFAANVDDAMHGLFSRRNPAYLGPVDAFRDAFEDLHLHQLAMLAGFRAAYGMLLQEFDPARLREQFEAQARSSPLALLGGGKSKLWELYETRFGELTQDSEDAFRRLFGDPFSEAYEEQFRSLKASRRARPRGEEA